MNLTVFGATGATGRHLVEQALVAGHDVTAFARTPSKLNITHEHLAIVQGDVFNAEQVENAIQGADAVLCALGQTQPVQPGMQTTAAKHIIVAMNKHGVRRLVTLTGAGVNDPKDTPSWFNRVMNRLLKSMAGPVLVDAEGHVNAIRSSGLDWVIVRVPMLTDEPGTGIYRVGYVGHNTGPRIPRADVAEFMLKQVTRDTYLCQAPMVST